MVAPFMNSCWICSAPADTGEHMFKRSDFRAILGEPSQASPFFLHSAKRMNGHVRSSNADALKMRNMLCGRCNSTTTKPYDKAWEALSTALRSKPYRSGDFVFGSNIWGEEALTQLTNVQLYFAKLMGCYLALAGANFDRAALADPIQTSRPCPSLYLRIRENVPPSVGISDIHMTIDNESGQCVKSASLYFIGPLAIQTSFITTPLGTLQIPDAWHPSYGNTFLAVLDDIAVAVPVKGIGLR